MFLSSSSSYLFITSSLSSFFFSYFPSFFFLLSSSSIFFVCSYRLTHTRKTEKRESNAIWQCCKHTYTYTYTQTHVHIHTHSVTCKEAVVTCVTGSVQFVIAYWRCTTWIHVFFHVCDGNIYSTFYGTENVDQNLRQSHFTPFYCKIISPRVNLHKYKPVQFDKVYQLVQYNFHYI